MAAPKSKTKTRANCPRCGRKVVLLGFVGKDSRPLCQGCSDKSRRT